MDDERDTGEVVVRNNFYKVVFVLYVMVDDTAECSKDCPFYHRSDNVPDLCKVSKDEKLGYATPVLGRACVYGLIEKDIQSIESTRLEEAAGE